MRSRLAPRCLLINVVDISVFVRPEHNGTEAAIRSAAEGQDESN
jgi:hypothetical protein